MYTGFTTDKPKHPLISIIDLTEVSPDRPDKEALYRTGFYSIICKRFDGVMKYGGSYYDRQFLTREKVSNDVVQKFETLLVDYFSTESLIGTGLPDVKYFASRLNLSPNYLSDLLKKFTGKTSQEHIHLQLMDRAKTMLWGTGKSVSEIAYDLGFEHPSHFTKLFKSKTGYSPKEYRHLN